jgi:hypothetical protein
VLAQLRAITAETKVIEAKISGAEWDRQWLQTERIERYAEYLGKVHNVGSSGRDYVSPFRWAALLTLRPARTCARWTNYASQSSL